MLKVYRLLAAIAAVIALGAAVACGTREVIKEIPVKQVVTETVVKEVPVEVVVEREVIKEVPVEVVVEKEVIREVEVTVERVVEKEVIREVEKPVIVEKEVVREVEVFKEVVVGEGEVAASVISWRASSAVTKLSPFTAVSGYTSLIGLHVFSTLMTGNPHDQVYAPNMAARWEVAPDGSSATFYLQKNAFFHDGEPVTADDIAFSFTAYMDPRTKSRAVQRLAMVKGAEAFAEGTTDSVEGINVIDDYTIRFDMAFPTGQFLTQAAGVWLLPEHILGSLGPEDIDDSEFFIGLGSQKPIGSGPWKFVKHEPDQFHELISNDDYYLGKPKIDRVFVHLITSPDTAQIAMQRGEIDGSRRGGFSPEVNQSFLADPRFLIAAVGGRGNGRGFSFNFRTDWIADARIHQAFMWALNRKQIVDTFSAGLGYIHNTNLFVPTGVETDELKARYSHTGDSMKARALLEEAGWDFDREVKAKAPGYGADQRPQMAAKQQMLADSGLRVTFETMETPVWAAVYYENYNYDLVYVGGWGGAVDHLNYYFHSQNTNAMGYATPELDALLDAVPRALNDDDLVRIGLQINEMFIEDLPIVVVSTGLSLTTYGAHVWIPGYGRRPQPSQLKEIVFTPQFAGGGEWNYLMHQTDIVEFGTTHPLNETGPLHGQLE